MSVATPIKAALETAKTADHTAVGATFATLGAVLTQPAQCLIITSTLEASSAFVAAWISIDGTNNQILVQGDTSLVIDVSGNKEGTGKLAFPKGTQFYVKQGPDGPPDGGDISLTAIYAR